MKIKFFCPNCQQKYRLDVIRAGDSFTCTKCKSTVTVPEPGDRFAILLDDLESKSAKKASKKKQGSGKTPEKRPDKATSESTPLSGQTAKPPLFMSAPPRISEEPISIAPSLPQQVAVSQEQSSQPYSRESTSKLNASYWLLLVSAVLLLGTVVTALMVYSSGSDNPRDYVHDIMRAVNANDATGLRILLTDRTASSEDILSEEIDLSPYLSMRNLRVNEAATLYDEFDVDLVHSQIGPKEDREQIRISLQKTPKGWSVINGHEIVLAINGYSDLSANAETSSGSASSEQERESQNGRSRTRRR